MQPSPMAETSRLLSPSFRFCILFSVVVLLEPLEPIRQRWSAITLVRELPNEQREWLGVPRDAKWTSIDRLEPDVADQSSGDVFRLRVVAAVHDAGSSAASTAFKHTEQHLARHRVECGDDARLRDLL